MGQALPTYNKIAIVNWYMSARNTYGKSGFEAKCKTFVAGDISPNKDMVVAITGANRGLGFSAALEFAKLDAQVHLLCRSETKGTDAKAKLISMSGNEKIHAHVCDASSIKSVNQFSQDFLDKFGYLDVLVNNAGGMPAEKTLTSEGHESIMASALCGVMLLTERLLPALRQSKLAGGSRVINVVSGGGFTVGCPDTTDLDFTKFQSKYDPTLFYAFSKRAQILLTEMWPKKKQEERNIRVFAMHPGWAETEGVNEALEGGRLGVSSIDGFRTAAQGADTIVWLGCVQREDALHDSNGKVFFDRAVTPSDVWRGTLTSEAQKEALWDAAMNYVGLA